MLEVNLNLVGIAVAILFYGALCAYLLRKPFAEGLSRFRALPRMVQVAMAVVAWQGRRSAQRTSSAGIDSPS